jgi:hypothetical protein
MFNRMSIHRYLLLHTLDFKVVFFLRFRKKKENLKQSVSYTNDSGFDMKSIPAWLVSDIFGGSFFGDKVAEV